jgi:hypothetical protein
MFSSETTQIYYKNYRKYNKYTVWQKAELLKVTVAGIHLYHWAFKYLVIIYINLYLCSTKMQTT